VVLLLVALVAVFFFARFVLYQYSGRARFSNAVALVILLAYAGGALSYRIMFAGAPKAAPSVSDSNAAPTPAPQPLTLGAGDARHVLGPSAATAAVGNLDVLKSRANGPASDRFAAGSTMYASGWAGTTTTRAPDAIIIIDGRQAYDLAGVYGGDRADVASKYGSPAMRASGFSGASISTVGLGTGAHQLQIGVVSGDGKQYSLVPTSWHFTVY
jgi:hypothetical protein